MRRRLTCVAVVVGLLVGGAWIALAAPAGAGGPSLNAFKQVGAWVDVFDYTPRLQNAGTKPRVTPDSIADMAALGVKTLYVQVANPDGAPSNQLTDRTELQALLTQAHDHGVAVVPWFLPGLTSPKDDLATMRQIAGLRAAGDKFDGIGLDLESGDEPDIALRNARTVAFAKQVRKVVGPSMPVAAIVYPAVQLELLNTTLWPDFPYRGVAKYVDLWMPMSYYTFRSTDSGLRNAYRYTVDSVTRLRARLGNPKAPVHLIGGLAEDSTPDDYLDMTRAAKATNALGWSVYDYATTDSWSWPYLRGQVAVPTTLQPPTTPAPSTAPPSTSSSTTTSTSSTTTSTTTVTTTATGL
jgi:hypothetical protein